MRQEDVAREDQAERDPISRRQRDEAQEAAEPGDLPPFAGRVAQWQDAPILEESTVREKEIQSQELLNLALNCALLEPPPMAS
jgi:DNA invertase Pin-like site-specific DNA recombinase